MARSGVSEAQIRQAIKQLEAKGVQPTVTLLRQQLGTGSFSTISGVLSRWKEEHQRAARRAVPEPPADLSPLFQQLWNEAFRSADALAEGERDRHATEKAALDKSVSEMSLEISRLEQALAAMQTDHEALQKGLQSSEAELKKAQIERARAESAHKTTTEELSILRQSLAKVQEQLPGWVERATRAETRLEELARKKKKDEK